MPRIPENEKLTPQETAARRGFAHGYSDWQFGENTANRKPIPQGEYQEYYDAYHRGQFSALEDLRIAAEEEEYQESRHREIFWDEKPWEREIGAQY